MVSKGLYPYFLVLCLSNSTWAQNQPAGPTGGATGDLEIDKIVYRNGTVFTGQIVEGTKSLVNNPDFYEILLENGSLISIQDTGQIETVILDGQRLDDPQQQGGRKRLREMLLEHLKEKEAEEDAQQKLRMTAVVRWLLGDPKKAKPGQEEDEELKNGARLWPGESIKLNSSSRIELVVAGKFQMAVEQGSLLVINRIAEREDPETGQAVLEFDFDLQRGCVWFEKPEPILDQNPVKISGLGLSFQTTEGLTRYKRVREGDLRFSHYLGPDLTVIRVQDGARLVTPPESAYMLPDSMRNTSIPFEPRREPVSNYNDWLEFKAWKPVELDFPIKPILVGKPRMDPRPVKPLMGLPSERFVFQDLQPIQMTGLAPLLSAHRLALREFKEDLGRLPTPEEGLAVLRSASGEMEEWKGPYLRDEVPSVDPWNQPLQYSIIHAGEDRLINLYSIGANGIDEQGLGDDLR
jgi:general secretion pathway protein G